MKQKGVHILLLLFILHNTALDQLLKLPTLVAHFYEHQQRDRRISVTDFLCMHYWGHDIDDNDDERDKQLPYKNVDIHTIQHAFVPLAKSIAIKHTSYRTAQINYPVIKYNNIPDPALSSLFRPPRA